MYKVGDTFGCLTYSRSAILRGNRKYVFSCNFCKKEIAVWGKHMSALKANPLCLICGSRGSIWLFIKNNQAFVYKDLPASDAYALLPKGDYEIYQSQANGEAVRLGAMEMAYNSLDWRESPSFLRWRETLLDGVSHAAPSLPFNLEPKRL